MTQPRLIGFTGYSRSGKDSLAAPLIARDFTNLAFSAVIKEFFDPYTKDAEAISPLLRRMQRANPEVTDDELKDFYDRILLPFEDHDLMIDAFTENDAEKTAIRPILERGGELIYPYVFREYFRRVDAAWSAGKSIVNTRIVRPEEAREWKKRGGMIYLVERTDWSAATDWEHEQVETLKLSGLIDSVLHNDGTAAEWDACAEQFAEALHYQRGFEEAAFRR